ncbi:SDR family NAD(P)-dependent oxidoreductase [Alkalihalobacterium chitinilyticum]|uniref:SDR family NAD(P)-dependent oxidoreductase n=1 Tax=Alkalihalobacterium chitinilyticum TaxID=2980103 RepID=A0ABT5VD37_9BACI|nr:SDR family NAD(P)-dependent oxidoreductase [Alkalihalobacterium chitinilyticum]MDE5413205.1 SDR family NAD(P)-dependent oxidoreductase [Alkalihalobacterium chitinilyticum]
MYKQRCWDYFLFRPISCNKEKLKKVIRGKSILITGASSGVGKELAYELADVDCHLVLVARRGDELAKIKKTIETKNARVSVFQADLRDATEMENFLSFLHGLPHGLDVVVNNAGLSIHRSINDSLNRYHDFTRTMAINYFAPVQLLLSVTPHLQRNKGHIINVSTINARLAPVPYFAAYQASKSAFDVWLRSTAPELHAQGVSTTSVYLPLIKTPMIEPTATYRNLPAMSPGYVARIICKSMYTKKKTYQPWWFIFGQIASIFLSNFSGVSTKKRGKGR